ncbi:MAG: hypothetical protein EOM64_06450, partial [Erysipelotrichia bacterium]|nr:hypothetical protein [Erysipelotrichia bacterium]
MEMKPMEDRTNLTAEQEKELLKPISDHISKIQDKINALRMDGTDKVISYQDTIDAIKRSRTLSKSDKQAKIAEIEPKLKKAKDTETANKSSVAALIKEAEDYLNQHFDSEYYKPVEAECERLTKAADASYAAAKAKIISEHDADKAKADGKEEAKEEAYVYKNRLFEAKTLYEKQCQEIKDRRHAAFVAKYHMIDLLRISKFTFAQSQAQKRENYKYNFNRKNFLLQNGLYIAILLIFIALCIATPIVKHQQLLTYNNVLNILQQVSPRIFLALGVAGLILLAGTDLSIGRMIGMCMTAATIVMHNGINTGSVFGVKYDFTAYPEIAKILIALIICIVLCTLFTTIAGFFTARFKMHPFIATMANMLVIYGLVTYATKGVSFGAIDSVIPGMVIPKINGFPTIIFWAVAAIAIVWFIWNKTTFGKNLYAVGGNPARGRARGGGAGENPRLGRAAAGRRDGRAGLFPCELAAHDADRRRPAASDPARPGQ